MDGADLDRRNAPPAPPDRFLLPERRRNVTVKVTHGDLRFHVTLGYYDDGVVGEVFATDAKKEGTEIQGIVSDACVWASIMMQHGISLATMSASLGRVPTFNADGTTTFRPASLMGAVMAVVLDNCSLSTVAEGGPI